MKTFTKTKLLKTINNEWDLEAKLDPHLKTAQLTVLSYIHNKQTVVI